MKLNVDMYSLNKPFKDIHSLLRFLKDDSPQDYLFRGQTKHYPTLLPSVFRRAMVPGSEGHALIEIDGERFLAEADKRLRLKFELLDHIITYLGKGVGNIVAQQYSVLSEALDVTTSPEIAAFFATTKYPSYRHFHGTKENELGVIYRFPKRKQIFTLEAMEIATDTIMGFEDNFGFVPFADFYRPWQITPEYREELNPMFEYYGIHEGNFCTYPVTGDFESARSWISKALESKYILNPKNYELTRIARQQGGFITTSVNWICDVPKNREIHFLPKSQQHAYVPGIALGKKITHAENLLQYTGCEALFFKHSARQVSSITKEHLWPSVEEDPIYKWLALSLELQTAGKGINIHSYENGLLDRGYY